MAGEVSLPSLIGAIARETRSEDAMDRIARAAAELSGSRHVMIALVNEEKGCLEVRYGAGEQFEANAKDELLLLDVSDEMGIVSYVAAMGETFTSGDVRSVPQYRMMFPSSQSELAVPVRDRESRVRAVLNLESDRLNAYGPEHVQLAEALGSLIGLILERDDHANREEALIQIGSSVDTALTEEALVHRVIQVAEEVLRFQACSIFILDPRTDLFVLRGTIGRLKDQVGKISYQKGQGFTGWVAETGQTILLNDPQQDPRWTGRYVEFPSEQIASFLAVPIVSRNRVIGVIRLLRRKSDNRFVDNRFTDSDRRLLAAISEQMATGLENLRNMEKIIRSERMIAWGELSAKSSHMIGNRVFALKGDINELGHLLSDGALDPKELGALAQSLSTNVMRIEEILRDFRDFVTATQLDLAPLDLNQLVRETAQEVFPRRSAVELQMELAEGLPPILLDQKKMRRAVSELIENSLNHMDRGRMRISTDRVEARAYDRTRASKFSHFARIEIEDSGPGVAPDEKALIFQPFFSKRVKGMGLGLSIVKGIIDAHGGEVFEAGREGEGAQFVILLPLA